MASRGEGSQRNWTVSEKDKTRGLTQWSPLNARHLKVLGLHQPSGSPCLTSYTASLDREHLASSGGRVFLRASYPLLPGSALHVPLGHLLIRTRLTLTSLKGPKWWLQHSWRHQVTKRWQWCWPPHFSAPSVPLLHWSWGVYGKAWQWGELHLLWCPSQATESEPRSALPSPESMSQCEWGAQPPFKRLKNVPSFTQSFSDSNCSNYSAICARGSWKRLQCISVMALLLFIERD